MQSSIDKSTKNTALLGMQIRLNKPLLNSHYNDNGTNTFKDIDTIYLDNIDINLVKNYYHFFRSTFVKASMEFTSRNPKQIETTTDAEAKIEPSQLAMVIFNGDQEIIDKSNELLLRVCFKDEALKNKLTEADLKQVGYDDWEELICNFLRYFWLDHWLTGAKKK